MRSASDDDEKRGLESVICCWGGHMTLAEIEGTVNVGQTISVMKFCRVETDK